MSYIPKDVKWFLAELVEEIKLADENATVVHKNLTLIGASSADEAYEKSMKLGQSHEDSYPNPEGQLVTIRFAGLADLQPIYEELEDGAEISFTEILNVDQAEIKNWVKEKKALQLFQPIRPSPAFDYSSREIVKEASSIIEESSE